MKKIAAIVTLLIAVAAAFLLQKYREKAGDGFVPAFSNFKGAPSNQASSDSQGLPSPQTSLTTNRAVTAEDQKKLDTLNQILLSKNDNDLRLDRDFNQLSPSAKQLFMDKYRALPREKLNQKGTIVYLLGRNLSSESDFNFLRDVLNEPACLSLADCSKDPGSASPEDLHHDMGTGNHACLPQAHVAHRY